MLSRDLMVTNLNMTEDYYDFKGTFELRGDAYMALDLSQLTDDKFREIQRVFGLPESLEEIKKELMEKLAEAAQIESRCEEGKNAM